MQLLPVKPVWLKNITFSQILISEIKPWYEIVAVGSFFILIVTCCRRRVRQSWVVLQGEQSKRLVYIFVVIWPSLCLSLFSKLGTTVLYIATIFALSALSQKVIQQEVWIWFHSGTYYFRVVWHVSWEFRLIKLTFIAATITVETISVIRFRCFLYQDVGWLWYPDCLRKKDSFKICNVIKFK